MDIRKPCPYKWIKSANRHVGMRVMYTTGLLLGVALMGKKGPMDIIPENS